MDTEQGRYTDKHIVTERARQLRAHYALQCSDLRSRIERRINRVPIGLRNTKMGELMAQHQDQQSNINPPPTQPIPHSPTKAPLDERPLPALPSPSKLPSPVKQPVIQQQKSRKRKSSAIHIPSDKENHEPDTSNAGPDSLPVQKNAKRAKTAAVTSQPAPKRAASRTQKKPLKNNDNPTGVLSPRSHNSRTLPRSPIKDKELLPPIPVREASPLRQQQQQSLPQQSPQRPISPSKSPFKSAMSGISAFAKRGYAAAGAAGAKLTRPISREKEQDILTGFGSTIPGSPVGKMLPPPRPALATLTGTNASATSIPTLSPQRTTSQASIRSNASAQSTTSSKGTVVTKSTRAVGTKKAAMLSKAPPKKVVTSSTTMVKTKGKVVVSGSTVSTLSPKSTSTGAGIKRTATTAAKKMAAAATTKRAAAAPVTTGRVLRKRN